MSKKYILFFGVLATIFSININASELTGDTKLACEALLCLSSGTRPSECSPSLNRYFSIKEKKWKDTIKARADFLKLCPVDGADIKDPIFADLRDNVLPNSDPRKCTASYFNSHPETKCVRESCGERRCRCVEYKYRPKTSIPSECQRLITHQYTNIRPKNICQNTKWYSDDEWYSGYTQIEISKKEYLKLKDSEIEVSFSNPYIKRRRANLNSPLNKFYKKAPIQKDCWINE